MRHFGRVALILAIVFGPGLVACYTLSNPRDADIVGSLAVLVGVIVTGFGYGVYDYWRRYGPGSRCSAREQDQP